MPAKTTRKKLKSQRPDGLGHWPAGKRRHADDGTWSTTRLGLTKLLDDHPRYGVISARALATAVGVSDHTIRRWLAGEDRPAPIHQRRVAAWLAEMESMIAREQRKK